MRKGSSSVTLLHTACLAGDVKRVNQLISSDPDTVRSDGRHLGLASLKEHEHVVSVLLDSGLCSVSSVARAVSLCRVRKVGGAVLKMLIAHLDTDGAP